MIKKILAIFMLLLLTACYPSYEKKNDNDVNYYTDWLKENDIVDYEKEPAPTGSNLVEAIYQLNGIDDECHSRNIRMYYGLEESTNKPVTVYMPDKAGKPNIIIYDLVYDLEILRQEIQSYNRNTELTEILLDEEQIRLRSIIHLWGGLIINDIEQEIDEEAIKYFVFSNLSNPMIFRIGSTGIMGNSVYLGLNKDNDYVIFSQSTDHNKLEVIHTYSEGSTLVE
jgi:hypothetical protein